MPPLALLKCLQSGDSQTRYGLIAGDLDRVHIPDRFAQVQRVRVVGGVHRQRLGVVVDGDVYRAPECGLKACGCAAASKVVDDEFAGKARGMVKLSRFIGGFPLGKKAHAAYRGWASGVTRFVGVSKRIDCLNQIHWVA